LERAPGPSKSFVRGKSGYVPFWPGGLDQDFVDPDGGHNLHGEPHGLRTVPPGFARGLHLPGDESQDETLAALDKINITSYRQDAEEVRCYLADNSAHLTHKTATARRGCSE
jgi:hypothetical protein